MKTLWAVFGLLLISLAGCAGDGDKGQWSEFWKDLRGDNMKMRYDMGSVK